MQIKTDNEWFCTTQMSSQQVIREYFPRESQPKSCDPTLKLFPALIARDYFKKEGAKK